MAEVPPEVPPVDAEPIHESSRSNGRDAFEFRLLEADAKARENLNREADQRYWLRWIAVGVVLMIIVAMGCLLNHVAHWLPADNKSIGAVIALHLAPIVSMTTLAIALMVAAFRGFKDGDEQMGTAIATEAAKVSGLAPH